MGPLIAICYFLLLILFIQVAGRYVLNYKVRETGVDVLVLGVIPVKRIPFKNVAEIREVSWRETCRLNEDSLFTLRIGNRLFGRGVLIRQKRWILRKIILMTPDKPDEFVREVLARLDALKISQ